MDAAPGKPFEHDAHTPHDVGVPGHYGRAQDGIAVVTLTKDGGIRERFLDQDSTGMRVGQAIVDAQADRVRKVLAACTHPNRANEPGARTEPRRDLAS